MCSRAASTVGHSPFSPAWMCIAWGWPSSRPFVLSETVATLPLRRTVVFPRPSTLLVGTGLRVAGTRSPAVLGLLRAVVGRAGGEHHGGRRAADEQRERRPPSASGAWERRRAAGRGRSRRRPAGGRTAGRRAWSGARGGAADRSAADRAAPRGRGQRCACISQARGSAAEARRHPRAGRSRTSCGTGDVVLAGGTGATGGGTAAARVTWRPSGRSATLAAIARSSGGQLGGLGVALVRVLGGRARHHLVEGLGRGRGASGSARAAGR